MREPHGVLHLIVYACDPRDGSEPGVGWQLLRQGLRWFDSVVVYTRWNNVDPVREALPPPDRERVRFADVDVPGWIEALKRGQRGVRLYYLAWQLGVARSLRNELDRTGATGRVHHATFATMAPPPLGVLGAPRGVPVMIGPTGGLASINWRLARLCLPTPRALGLDLARQAVIWGLVRTPVTRAVVRRAGRVVVQSEAEGRAIFGERRDRYEVVNNSAAPAFDGPTAFDGPPAFARRSSDAARLLYVGDLLFSKGVLLLPLLLQALPSTYTLTVAGDGPAGERLGRLARQVGVGARTALLGRVPREEVQRLMREHDVLVLPSLREGAPAVITEALAAGCSCLSFDVGSIRELVPPGLGVQVPNDLSSREALLALARGAEALVAGRSGSLRGAWSPETWEDKGERLYGAWAHAR